MKAIGIIIQRRQPAEVSTARKICLKSTRLIALLVLFFASAVQAQEAATQLAMFTTTETGIHRVSYQELLAQGIDLQGYDHADFGLSSQGQPVQIRTQGQLITDESKGIRKKAGDQFGPGGFIEFYADQSSSRYDERKVYTLSLGDEPLRMLRAKGKKHQTSRKIKRDAKKAGKNITVSTYQQTLLIEQDSYYDFLTPSDTDPWHFGQLISRGGVAVNMPSLSFELEGLAASTATLDLEVYGLSDANRFGEDHQVLISVNNIPVVDALLDGQMPHAIQVEDVAVQTGVNDFALMLNGTPDTAFSAVGLNRVSVSYPRFAMSSDAYLEGVFADRLIAVEGFPIGERVQAYRRHDDGSFTYFPKLSRSESIALLRTDRTPAYYIFAADSGLKKAQVMAISQAEQITQGSAEYLIIAHTDFIGSELDRLVQLKELAYTTKVVSVQDVYNQFGEQIPSAEAVHDYIRFAVTHLNTQFVALIGSDSYDYKGVQSYAVPVTSYIPTLYRDAQAGALRVYQMQSDAAYGDIDGDQIPDIPVGRFPVQTLQDLDNMVSKLEQYEIATPFTFATLIADSGFSGDADSWISSLPDGSRMKGQLENRFWEAFRPYVDSDGPSEAHSEVIQSLNLGVVAVNYFGHGSMAQLGSASPALLTANDTQLLNNYASPFVMLQWGSWTGSFANADGGNNLMYNILTASRTGAATLTGLSSLTSRTSANRLARELSGSLYQQNATLGGALIEAKQALAMNGLDSVKDAVLGLQIIGDPAIIVNWWPD